MSLEKAQEQLQEILVKTFFSNLELLKKFDNELYCRVNGLSQAIETEVYKERYFLEFIQEANEFDIYDSHTKEYLYKRKPKQFNRRLFNSVNLDKKSYFSSLLREPYDLNNSYQEVNFDYESYEELEPMIYNDMKEFTDILKDDTTKEKVFNRIEKFVFVGTLLGRHLIDIHRKIMAKSYFICENNLEIFRLSLFVINYADVFNGTKIRFSIMDDENSFIKKYQLFLEDNSDENYYIKYSTTNYNVSEMMNKIISTMYKINPMTFDYTRSLYNLVKLTSQRVNSDNILVANKKEKGFDFSNSNPVLFVAAGPSLQDNILWLKKYQDRFIIVAIGASYKLLLQNGITPDIISSVEPSFWELEKHHFTKENIENLQNTIFLFSIITPKQLTNTINPENVFYFEINNSFKSNSTIYKGYSVGELTVSLLLDMGVKELYMLGTDLAINKKTGETHFSNYKDLVKKEVQNINITKSLETTKTSYKDDLIPVTGNFEKEVLTTRIFISSIFAYMQTFEDFKKENQKVINLSNHGAYLQGSEAKKVEDIEINTFNKINKKDIKQILLENLNKISENKLTVGELAIVKKEIEYFSELIKCLENEKKHKIDNFNQLKQLLEATNQNIKKIGYATLLNFVYEEYSKLANIYICYCFNNKKIKNEQKKIMEVKKVWLNQVIRLTKQYIEYLEDILKSKGTF
ncbi:6-hydroxymethylpterin diphosphokinase MptE-like protein [Halarcobacter ebronensis]|uniref:Motility accessory factor n=1 Tax=Halarcobacter ebronensis TaxID=1462615 RepID=A0A4Q1AL73_9BACT|nr:6-hydroxymethylpterin diphosphokinase MptE-like protein [Halarcobacter ebronensis]QKF83298.1 motility accessory factor [Halarcobacter ebronensis]RXK05861.1 hypothetical protein CRV07_07250 [Halarcobacter ebronensis]